MSTHPTEAEIRANNPQLDEPRVNRYEVLLARLASRGIDLTPRYELTSRVGAAPFKSQLTKR